MTNTDVAQPTEAAIPTPPDFPVAWERPEDARALWTTDPMHTPEPVFPLEFSVAELATDEGWNAAAETYGAPARNRVLRINTYQYGTSAPLPLPPEELARLEQVAQERVGQVMARFAERWQTVWQPELAGHVAYWRGFDLRGATLTELIAHLDETRRRIARAWEIHFELAFPMILSMSAFADMYADLFGADRMLDAYRLLQGFDNKSLEADRALWRLSRAAGASPAVREILARHADADVVAALERTPAAAAFLAELRSYLEEYGRRADKFAIIAVPSWIEDPTPAIKSLKDYMAQPDRDIAAETARLAAEREERLAEARAALAGYPQPVVEQFELLLRAAQTGTVLQEDHNFWIDQRCMYEVRRVALEFGRRFAEAGVIDQPDDVFFLTLAEVRETAETMPYMARQVAVARRRAEMEHFRVIAPPPALGTLPPGSPPDSAFGRAVSRFFGGPPQQAEEPGTLQGNAGSPGVVRGVVKVVRSLAEAAKLTRGDILVAETTAPPWTPLFATAAGIVTDTGGVLSHCAVVAREYGIPAVVGAAGATRALRDGMVVELDGGTGLVRIIDEV